MDPIIELIAGLIIIAVIGVAWHLAVRSYVVASLGAGITAGTLYVVANLWRFGELVASDVLSFAIVAVNTGVVASGIGIPFYRRRVRRGLGSH